MADQLAPVPATFGDAISERMASAHVDLAARWLDDLRQIIAVPPREVFPTASLLDHIPGLIRHIAEALRAEGGTAMVANTEVVAKAQELGELRFSQRATVHQILREYRLLSEVLTGFVADQLESLGDGVPALEVLQVSVRLQESLHVLMQTTVDTFVARYADTIAGQTARLEGFNKTVSHELRQPLGAIRSAVELIRGDDGSLASEARARCLDVIARNSQRMATLTTTLLTLSSLDVDSLQVQEADLGQIANDVCDQLADMAASRQVVLRPAVPAIRVNTDVARLELVLINLISNAVKYSDPKKTERVVDVIATDATDEVRVSVVDNGLGIPKDLRNRVFEGFVRAHATRDRELGTDGVGLGLAIVAECVRHLGATLNVESDDGRGTSVHVILPKTVVRA